MSRMDRMKIGQTATVEKVGGIPALQSRLTDMGFVPGVSVRLLRTAPFGDPMQFFLRGYTLCLRKKEAREVTVVDVGVDRKPQQRKNHPV